MQGDDLVAEPVFGKDIPRDQHRVIPKSGHHARNEGDDHADQTIPQQGNQGNRDEDEGCNCRAHREPEGNGIFIKETAGGDGKKGEREEGKSRIEKIDLKNNRRHEQPEVQDCYGPPNNCQVFPVRSHDKEERKRNVCHKSLGITYDSTRSHLPSG